MAVSVEKKVNLALVLTFPFERAKRDDYSRRGETEVNYADKGYVMVVKTPGVLTLKSFTSPYAQALMNL